MDFSKDLVKDMLLGKISLTELKEMQRSSPDPDRFHWVLEIENEKTSHHWDNEIFLCLQENLYVVKKNDKKIVKCLCGYEFSEYTRNWKDKALVYERDCSDGTVFVGPRAADPDYMILREFYCPGCGLQLEVEAVPPGYPFVFNFIPDID